MTEKTGNLLKDIAVYLILALIIYLFYKSIWAFVLMVPACIIYRRYSRKIREAGRKKKLQEQFKDALMALADALSAGYSMENAIKESLHEVGQVYGQDAPMCRELKAVINQNSLNTPLEDALDQMAERCRVEDISTFASVFRIAKRSGGNLTQIIRSSAEDIAQKSGIISEINVLISSKRLEQNLMMLMPAAMILYIDLASPGILDPLYGNLMGIIIMTVCLGIYALSFFISRKIINIEV